MTVIYQDQLGASADPRAEWACVPARAPSQRSAFVAGQPEITRNNLAQIVAVTAEIGGGHDLGSTAAAVQSHCRQARLPSRTASILQVGGAYKQQQLAAHGMIKVFAAAVVGEAILLLYLYESFWLPLIIILSR